MASVPNGPRFVVVDVLPRLPLPPRTGNKPFTSGASLNGKQQQPKVKKAPKRPVTFTLDSTSPKCILVENLEEKEVVRTRNGKGQWVMPKPYTPEERQKFDRDSVLYYFQCVLKCPITTKFTLTRLNIKVVNKDSTVANGNTKTEKVTEAATSSDQSNAGKKEVDAAVTPATGDAPAVRTIRPLKLEFTAEKDAQAVIAAYKKSVLNQTK